MNFPITHPIWMWLYFGAFGIAGAILFTLVIWYAMKAHSAMAGHLRTSAKWSMVGYLFLFLASYSACGIGGPPGNLLSSNPGVVNVYYATVASVLSIFFSVPGWICLLVSQRLLIRSANKK